MKVLFWGTPEFALPTLRALGEEGHQLVGVVTQPDRPAGRGRELSASPVKRAALREALPVLQPERARGDEFIRQIRQWEPDLSVVVAFGQILQPEVLAVPRFGSVNVHASLLPDLRGAAPVHWAILNGLEKTGVSIMRMEKGLDSGPVLFQVAEPIGPDTSMSELAMRLAATGAEALIEALALMEAGALTETPQDHDRATYAPKVSRELARLDWTRPADHVARWIRGLDSVPGAWSVCGNDAVKLFRARAETGSGAPGEVLEATGDNGLLVAAAQGAVRIREVQPPGKRRMPADDWVRGRAVGAGDHLH